MTPRNFDPASLARVRARFARRVRRQRDHTGTIHRRRGDQWPARHGTNGALLQAVGLPGTRR